MTTPQRYIVWFEEGPQPSPSAKGLDVTTPRELHVAPEMRGIPPQAKIESFGRADVAVYRRAVHPDQAVIQAVTSGKLAAPVGSTYTTQSGKQIVTTGPRSYVTESAAARSQPVMA